MRYNFFVFLITLAIVFFAGCGSNDETHTMKESSNADETSRLSMEMEDFRDSMMESSVPMAKMSRVASLETPHSLNKEHITTELSQALNERKLIVNVNMRLESKSAPQSCADIESKVASLGGYIENMRSFDNGCYLTARIPKELLERFIVSIEEGDKVIEKNINTQDITEAYFDNYNRVKNREVLLEKLRNYLKFAKNIGEILEIEDRINRITYEIEGMKGRLRGFDNKVDYATMSLDIRNEYGQDTTNEESYLSKEWKRFKEHIGGVFVDFMFKGLKFVAIALPFIFGLILFYYVCFGRLGLIKKLFRWIK
ncbi:hypothetical protein CCZ01_00855 [Helicobacter monodelphidis]|uniref:DUF4349 domain-containing protein n=1 Tax=Helicobacter sp. 15-1451 TaxID=2004995 RepID=UPI000DCCE555|nr:DUF4349 domain-containing protein [Helicobacter sp. 15-1451]RAX59316.1 hypothetical protein CCZ01_00855 [Helicobacter sp. 15-1451]